jgi:hypothetical protein
MTENPAVRNAGSVELFVGSTFRRLDELIARLAEKKFWFIWIGIFAVALSLAANTPVRSMILGVGNDWVAEVFRMQIAHPFTPIDLHQFEASAIATHNFGMLTHLDKIAFRLSVPVIAKILHTGRASFLVLNYIAGLLFFPLLASVANSHLNDRVSAAYVTLAFGLSWAGQHFFNDWTFGDGFAWTCLLAAIAFRHPAVIFPAILVAGFTDERGIVASTGVALYWLGATAAFGQTDTDPAPKRDAYFALLAIVAALIAYFGLRFSLAAAFGLKTGSRMMFELKVIWSNLAYRIPFGVLKVFEGLWLWLPIGVIAFYVSGRRLMLLGFVAIFACIFIISLIVFDIDRSLGYAFVLLPVAWQARQVKTATVRTIARSCFLFGLCLIVPYATILRYLHSGPLLPRPF